MRFITEFELLTDFEIKNYKHLREKGTAEWLGLDIEKAFGWKSTGQTTIHGTASERHTLEIEAFPMDKWIEFKNSLFEYIVNAGGMVSGTRILEMIKKLEFYNIQKEQKEG
jgi:hypothetical protein